MKCTGKRFGTHAKSFTLDYFTMNKLAVDIALIPPLDIIDIAMKGNQTIPPNSGLVKLGKTSCVPHISLCMGVAKKHNLELIQEIVLDIARNSKPLALTLTKLDFLRKSTGEIIASEFSVDNTPEIQKLHETCMSRFVPILSQDAAEEMFWTRPDSLTVGYVRGYRDKKSFEPHMTLGRGEARIDLDFPIMFSAETLALCHIGKAGSCGTILFSTKLGNS